METLIFPGEDHGFFLHENRRRMVAKVLEFLETYAASSAASN